MTGAWGEPRITHDYHWWAGGGVVITVILWWSQQGPLTPRCPNPSQWTVHFTHLVSTQGKLGVKKEWMDTFGVQVSAIFAVWILVRIPAERPWRERMGLHAVCISCV